MIKVQSFIGVIESGTVNTYAGDRLDDKVNSFIEDKIERFSRRVIDVKFASIADGDYMAMAMVIYED